MLPYARENGCPWDYRTCDNAAKYYEWYDNLECLKYAHENGCPGSSYHWHLLPSVQAYYINLVELEKKKW